MIQQKEGAKGRSFGATCLGFATADGLPGNCARYGSDRGEWGHNARHGFNLEVGGERYSREGIETIGLRHAISFNSSHEVFEMFLAEQVALFFGAVTPP